MTRYMGLLIIPLLFVAWSLARADETPTAETDRPPVPAGQPFPILPRIELPREYGFFVGDEIPLTLIVEVAAGARIDLVNLPQKGNTHGVFEVRDVHIKEALQGHGKRVYRLEYLLQYFGPAPLTVIFPPLEILYAHDQERDAVSGAYDYHTLLTQPAHIHIARLGPLAPADARTVAAPFADERTPLTWGLIGLGGLCLAVGSCGLGRQGYRQLAAFRRATGGAPTPEAQALEALRGVEHLTREERLPEVSVQVSEIVRRFLGEVYLFSPFTKTTAELVQALPDGLYRQEVHRLLSDCDVLKFGARPGSRQASQALLSWAVGLIQRFGAEDGEGQSHGAR
jgi:hypothetical protein